MGKTKVEKKLDDMMEAIDVLETAFPGRDIDGHRRYHQSLIDLNEEKRKFYKEMRKKTLFALFWLGITWLGVASYHEIERIIILMFTKGG